MQETGKWCPSSAIDGSTDLMISRATRLVKNPK
jgi:hypothetical protein